MADVIDACREPLSRNGIAVTQIVVPGPKETELQTMLVHESGQWICSGISLVADHRNPQSMGSAITYLRRYTLAAIANVGVRGEDDDGEGAKPKPKSTLASKGNSAANNRPRNAERKTTEGRAKAVRAAQAKTKTQVVNSIEKWSGVRDQSELGSLVRSCVAKSGVRKGGDQTPLTNNEWSKVGEWIEKNKDNDFVDVL